MDSLEQFLNQNNIPYTPDTPIEPYLTMGIGGNVRMVISVTDESILSPLLVFLQQNREQIPFILLGGGSNVIFPSHAPELVVVLNRTSGVWKLSPSQIVVNSGVPIKELMKWNGENNVDGMDFLAGIPGSVGGAAAVNAGAFGCSISSILENARIVDRTGQIKTVDKNYFHFTYRDSEFKYGDEYILDVTLTYTHAPNDQVKQKIDERMSYRINRHPGPDNRSAGCFFKNPVIDGEKIPAGRIIENLGLKGTTYHRLLIAKEHANFVINKEHASFDDVREFEKFVTAEVEKTRGIHLEREVIYISPKGKRY